MPSFDATPWEDEELLLLLQTMFLEFDLCSKFAIDINTLRNFLYEAYKNYNDVPFHNFRHCFCVTQMMYSISRNVNITEKIGDLELLILLTSCICHDLDHPGYNNIYQINAKTELAIRYNDISPLENHHCSVAFRILENEECNIFKCFSSEEFKQIREGIIRCILATDMARHNEILTNFKDIIPIFDANDKSHVNLLCMVLIKVSDISNEARPMDVAEPWLDKLLLEFFKQSDAEKLEGLPVTPFMDREKITKPSSQCSFIGLVLLPLFEALGELLPELINLIVQPVRDALDYYRRLNEATKEERLQRKSIVAELAEQNNTPSSQSPDSSIAVPKSSSNTSVKIKKSLSFQQNSSRSRSTDDEPDLSSGSGNVLIDGQSLDDVAEDPESGESETATEVEVSEKTLKFKISTESTSGTGRKSYPGSRKGSREKVQNLNSSELTRMIQRGKLRAGALSFDQHCLGSSNKKLSFDPPEFLDEYAIILKKKLEDGLANQCDEDDDIDDNHQDCVLSKETLNLNKRNSEHSVKIPSSIDETRSILKCSEKIYSNNEKLQMNNTKVQEHRLSSENGASEDNGSPQKISDKIYSINDQSDKCSDVGSSAKEEKENITLNENKARSIFARFRQFTDRFGFSVDKDSRLKSSKNNSVKSSSARSSTPTKSKKKLEGMKSYCKSLEEMSDRRASTLPKIKKSGTHKKGWKLLGLGKEKECWASDAAVDTLTVAISVDKDNQSLASTSQLSDCPSPKKATDIRQFSKYQHTDEGKIQMDCKFVSNQKMNDLQNATEGPFVVATSDKDPKFI
ncbi:hypothetical protein WA026_003443 [Henosepilachna vigintioctopunctata]|uniref:Phosphodiesterase n=1 Tax=Henosepilachna vigintioctopunctata TaxID=420089 RepID=A0AAW1TMW0_9CUCU